MRVLMLDAPQAMLDERGRLGLDGRDEMWDGVLHIVPPPGGRISGSAGRSSLLSVAWPSSAG